MLTENIFPKGPIQSNEISPSVSGAISGVGKDLGNTFTKAIAASAVALLIVTTSSTPTYSADSAATCSISKTSDSILGAE